MTGRISRVAALVATLTVTLVFALPSAHASAPPTPINGFADVHVHQFANLGFGGLVLWGQSFTPDNSIETALPWDDWTPGHYGDVVDKNGNPVGMTSCPNLLFPSKCVKHSEVLHADCPPDHGYDIFNPCDGFSVHGAGGTGDLVNAFSNGSLGHPVGGYPEFDGWPRYDNVTSQAVYYDWLQRAYKGGLRLMVMLAVNNEVLCKAGAHIAAFGCADMPAVDRQLQAAHDLEAFVDAQYGGPGQGWYRIVTTPAQARQVTAAGKLAVVLGIEVDTLFGCNKHSTCTTAYINQQLDHYKALGVTHVFPVHLTDNGFGGTALYDDMFAFNNKAVTGDWWDYADSCGPDRSFHLGTLDTLNDVAGIPIIGDWFNGLISSLLGVTGGVPPRPPAGPDCNARGLTQAGTDLVNGLIDRHMIMDVDHMDIPTFNAAMSIAEARHYPGISSGHTGIAPTANSSHAAHEGNKTLADLERIRDDGGMVSIILHQGGRNDIKTTMRGGSAPVPFDCGNSDQAWAQVYLYAADHMNGGAVGIGSDFNGLAGEPAPRFGPDACDGDKPNPYNPAAGISYPLTPFGGGAPLGQMHIGDRTFDYNNDGLANIGLYPDFIADLHQIGLSNQDLNPLFHSAEAYVRMWEAASDVAPPEVSCGTPTSGWSATNIAVSCSASDYPSDLMDAADASFTLATSVAAGMETSSAATSSRVVCDKRNNCVTVGPFTGLKVDRKAPAVSCAAPDTAWHAADVALLCTSIEGGSGFTSDADASFNLTTSVPAGTETDNASTGSRTVCDLVGNCSTVGPFAGNKVDKKAPVIVITAPAATSYLHNSTLTLGYTVTDGGSGVAAVNPTLDGSDTVGGHGLASGQAINLLTELPSGSHSFALQTADAVGNSSNATVAFQVVVTPDSLRDEVGLFRTGGDIVKQGIANSLLAKLAAAQSSRAAGDCATAANQYSAFVNEVQAQAGKAIDNGVASILIADAQYLIAHCP